MKCTVRVMLALTVLIALTTCRASKSEKANITSTENTRQEINSYSATESNLYTDIRTIIQKAFSESMDFTKKETEYDSDKPVQPETGKPPVKRETQTNLARKSEDKTNTIEKNYTVRNDTRDSTNYSTVNTSIDSKIDKFYETNLQNESDIFLKWVGGIAISLAVLSLILYILYKYWKKH